MLKTMKMVVKEEGFRALYQGLSASMIGVLHPMIYFPLYEKSKQYFKQNYHQNQSEQLSHKYVMVSAVMSKLIASAFTYPHEVI